LPYGSPGVDGPAEGVVRSPEATLAEAARLLAAGRPFHAHEVFEDAWKSRPATERPFWQGLAQLAVGLTHAARGNPTGAARLIERGAANLAAAGGPSYGVDVAAVLSWSQDAAAAAAAGGVPAPPPLGQ
jgi:predicted metal-dependent hydrolase